MVQMRDLPTSEEFECLLPEYRDEDVILFEEGLIGFPSAKRFVLIESETLSPFRIRFVPTVYKKAHNRPVLHPRDRSVWPQ